MSGFVFIVTMINVRKNMVYELFVVAENSERAMMIVNASNRTSHEHPDDWQPRDARPLQTNVRDLEHPYQSNFSRGVETTYLVKP